MPNGRSYNWTLHLDATGVQLVDLSEAAREGYGYACELAEDALERSRDPRRHTQQEPLTVEQLANENGLESAQLAHLIALARRRLFGSLSDAAIYKRLQRQRNRKPRRCAHANCTTMIPITAPANKQYCDHHASGAERVRRHRQQNTPRRLGGYGHAGQNARDRNGPSKTAIINATSDGPRVRGRGGSIAWNMTPPGYSRPCRAASPARDRGAGDAGSVAGMVEWVGCLTSGSVGHDPGVGAATYTYEVRCRGEIVSTGKLLLDARPDRGDVIDLGVLSGTIEELVVLAAETRLIVEAAEPR